MWLRSILGFVMLWAFVMYQRCTPAVIQLDPEWSLSSVQDGGTQYADTSVPIPTTCIPATDSWLRQSSAISGKRGSLFFGQHERAKNLTIYAVAPSGWTMAPNRVLANNKGEFAFWIHRQETAVTGQEKITVWANNLWCYLYTPTTTERENQKKIQNIFTQPCQTGQKKTLSLEIQGKLAESALGFSTQPDIVAQVAIREEEKSGRTLLSVDYHCLQKGSAFLLIGGEDIDAQMIPIEVEK